MNETQHTSKHSPRHPASCEKTNPFPQFLGLVPRPHNVLGPAVGRRLGNALEESDGAELGEVMGCCRAHGQAGPDYAHEREPDSGCDFLDDEPVGDLADDV